MPILSLEHIHIQELETNSWCAIATVNCTLLAPLTLWHNPHLALQSYKLATDIKHLCWQKLSQQSPLSVLDIAYHKRQQQRNGVRLLLQHLLTELNLVDSLNDSAFPYRLTHHDYYVCFSHSDNHKQRLANSLNTHPNYKCNLQSRVAVAISRNRPIGIDIETQDIAWLTVQRYYHPNELDILSKMAIAQRDAIAKCLWQLKESFIKIYNYKLAQGLGIDYSAIINSLIDNVINKENKTAIATIEDYWYKETHKTSAGILNYKITLLPQQQVLIIF